VSRPEPNSGSGASLGAAVHDLLGASPVEHRSLKQQLDYLTAKTTGASRESVARQLGTTQKTLSAWTGGKRKPTAANRDRIAQLFERFWQINHKSAGKTPPGDRMLRVKGKGVHVNGRPRTSVIVETGARARQWDTLRDATDAQISAENGSLFISALDIPIPYLEFRDGYYRITAL